MLVSIDDIRGYIPGIALFCVVTVFVMSASAEETRVVFITAPCALIFLWLSTILLERKSQTLTLQFNVIAACTFTLYGFTLGADYVFLHMTTGTEYGIFIADIVLLCISFACYAFVWLKHARDVCERCRVQSSSDLFETTSDGH